MNHGSSTSNGPVSSSWILSALKSQIFCCVVHLVLTLFSCNIEITLLYVVLSLNMSHPSVVVATNKCCVVATRIVSTRSVVGPVFSKSQCR